MTKRFGFTLAEVLITLAIIGVVAAMTLPTLIQKHQKRVLGERFKQSISILSQGFQKMMADEGVTDFRDTTYYKVCKDIYWYDHDAVEACRAVIKTYFKVVNTTDINLEDKNDEYLRYVNRDHYKDYPVVADELKATIEDIVLDLGGTITLSNGLKILGAASNGIVIDTNGNAKPNTLGRDVFILNINNSGSLVPLGFGVDECPAYPIACGDYLYKNNFVMDY